MPKIRKTTPSKLAVQGEDLKNLRASGLTDATIRANRLRTELDPSKLAQILNCSRDASCCLGGLVFPYLDIDGNVNCFARVRPHKPRTTSGTAIKYEQPKGEPSRAYFPAGSLIKLRDGKSPVHVTEGEKKALALAQLGLAAVGIGGVWCGCKRGTEELLDELANISWQGRDVYIVFDYDEKSATRRQVELARQRISRALRSAGAYEVYSVQLPPGFNGVKQGVDDFLVAHGEAQYHELVLQAKSVPAIEAISAFIAAGRTDVANGARLASKYREEIRWLGAWDKWLVWDGQRWRPDQFRRIEALAKDVAADLWKEVAAVAGKKESETITKMAAFAASSNSANSIRCMVAMAKSEEGVAIGVEELDSDPWLLNVQNGTLDLRTGRLHAHRQSDFLTKLSPVMFDSNAICPQWQEFLRTVFRGRIELIEYIQRLVGYSLTGVTVEHMLPFLYGTGANGKSTFAEILLKLLGPDYAMKAPPDLLMAKRGESHPTERADLFGKRFVACIETEDGRRLAEALVKELTGGDRVRARRMREDFWEFTPTHHVWLAGNHKPVVTGSDHGIWRRIKLIPFEVTIPNHRQDKKLPEKLAAELPGILNWALEGCRQWQSSGMQEPRIVQAATETYSSEMDEVGKFIEEYCETRPEFVTRARELFEHFQQKGGTMTQQAFGSALHRRGLVKHRLTRGPYKSHHAWKGLRIRATSNSNMDNSNMEDQ